MPKKRVYGCPECDHSPEGCIYCWPDTRSLPGELEKITDRLRTREMFGPIGGPPSPYRDTPSPEVAALQEMVSKLKKKASNAGRANRFNSLTKDSLFVALRKHADERLAEGKHPRPGWKTSMRKRLGFYDNRSLKSWMSRIGLTDDDVEDFLNENPSA